MYLLAVSSTTSTLLLVKDRNLVLLNNLTSFNKFERLLLLSVDPQTYMLLRKNEATVLILLDTNYISFFFFFQINDCHD